MKSASFVYKSRKQFKQPIGFQFLFRHISTNPHGPRFKIFSALSSYVSCGAKSDPCHMVCHDPKSFQISNPPFFAVLSFIYFNCGHEAQLPAVIQLCPLDSPAFPSCILASKRPPHPALFHFMLETILPGDSPRRSPPFSLRRSIRRRLLPVRLACSRTLQNFYLFFCCGFIIYQAGGFVNRFF